MPLQKEFQLIVKHILCIYGFFLAVLDSTSLPFSVMKCPIARNLMYESMFFFFLLCIAGSNKIWQVWRRRGHGFNFLRRLSIDSDTWKANKRFIILLFSVEEQNFWSFLIFLRSLVSTKSSGVQKSYFWVVFHHKELTKVIIHSISLWATLSFMPYSRQQCYFIFECYATVNNTNPYLVMLIRVMPCFLGKVEGVFRGIAVNDI